MRILIFALLLAWTCQHYMCSVAKNKSNTVCAYAFTSADTVMKILVRFLSDINLCDIRCNTDATVRLFIRDRAARNTSQIARFMGPTWGPPGSCQPQMGPILAPWTLLSVIFFDFKTLWDLMIRRRIHYQNTFPRKYSNTLAETQF